ncbi:MAG: TRAP transporter large permease subunit [Rhodospirillales bacterium]|nr:TRAP transporter large permease subunit [Rhodospirillales bacterium]
MTNSTTTDLARKPSLPETFIPKSLPGVILLLVVVLIGLPAFWELVQVTLYEPYGDTEPFFTFEGILADVSIGWLSILMFGALLIVLMVGMPLAFVTGSLAVVFIYMVGDRNMLNLIPPRVFPMMTNYQLSAIPLFIFMASMLERAGLIDEMFDVVYKWLGGVRGGLASAAIIASTILAAMVGIIAAAIVTMGIIALPAMLKRDYNHRIALGAIMAGGTLGILIPPSILAIIYAVVAQESVGELYAGSVFPGLLLSGVYVLYVTVRCYLNPAHGPALPPDERVGWGEKLRLLGKMAAPMLLVLAVLGAIFIGIATPVEAAGIGSLGAMVVAAIHKRLSIESIAGACISTMKSVSMVLWIMFGATIFVGFYVLQGGQEFVSAMILGTGMGPYMILLLMMVILVILGMFLDWVGILLLAVPIFLPIVTSLSFAGLFGLPGVASEDIALWFGVIYLVNMQMSFLSPPFGYAIFFLRGVTPEHIPTSELIRGTLPFLALQSLVLFLCILFPEIVLWLPRLLYAAAG